MNERVKNITVIALMAALICILGPLSIPIGPVPISLTNFAIYVIIYVLGTKKANISYLIYLLIGLIGIPVFSGFTSGVEKLLGPTGGFLIGFIPMIFIAGFFIERFQNNKIVCILGMFLSTVVVYGLGVFWLSYSASLPLPVAFAKGALPFLVEDFLKMVVAAFLGPVLNERLNKAGVAIER